MGQCAMTFKLMPTDVDVDFAKMRQSVISKIPKDAKLNGFREVPIAFGLKALEVSIILNDKTGGGDEIERLLAEIEDVSSVDLVQMGLL
jgi:elongation factor 1-beta